MSAVVEPKAQVFSFFLEAFPKRSHKVTPRNQSIKTPKTCGRREKFRNVTENVIDDAPYVNDEYEEDSTNGDEIRSFSKFP